MAKVGAAAAAVDFCPRHAIAVVGYFFHIGFSNRFPEAGPAGAAFKLGSGSKEFLSTADAGIGACLVVIPVLARKGGFGAFFTGDLELFGGELLFPFRIGLVHFVFFITRLGGAAQRKNRERGHQ